MRSMRSRFMVALISIVVVGCAGTGANPTASPGDGTISASGGVIHPSTPGPSTRPTPRPTLPPLALVHLRYRLIEQVGRPIFCDPDFYPVARDDEGQLARERYPEIRADAPTFEAITAHLRLDPSASPSADQMLAIYREWKALNALVLTNDGPAFRFDYVVGDEPGAESGTRMSGTIDGAGTITLKMREPSTPLMCPICLARGSGIATPAGPVPVEALRPGAAVWAIDAYGRRVVGTVLAVGSTPVPSTHRVIHLRLADGRSVHGSPGHPLPDGRRLGELAPGDLVDGVRVVMADLVPYQGGATFDLLTTGRAGAYWANGVLLASTLIP